MNDHIIRASIESEPGGVSDEWCKRLKREAHLLTYHDKAVVEAVMYKTSRGTVTYCNLWVHGADGRFIGGRGQAGGHGAHKSAGALQEAIRNAGIRIVRNGKPAILGGGMDMRDALLGIARLMEPGASRFGYFEI